MTRRSYRQHCALARALDLVGERWTLLVVRELLTGPKRYRDLLANLPGMGTNLLATRLRDLQEADLVEHDEAHYSLTPRGCELEPAVLALARFGAPLLAEGSGNGGEGDLWRASWNVVALKYAFDPKRARKLRGVIEYQVDDTRVQARLRDGTIETSPEPRWTPDVVLRADGSTFLALSSGALDPKQAEAEGALAVEGDRRLFRASLRAFSLG